MGTLMKRGQPILFLLVTILAAPRALAQSENLAAKSQQATELMAEGKFAEAVPLYRDLNRALPDNAGLMLNLGMALHMAGEERKAIPPLQAAVKLDPNLTPAWLFLGAARLRLREVSAAANAFREVIRLEPDHRQARQMFAGALLSLNRFEESAEQYRKLTELNPESSQAWYGLGRSYESLAGRAFEDLQRSAPGSAYWLALIAETRVREQQFSSAFYLYRQALEKMPGMPGLHKAVAEIYRQTGHSEWANAEEEKDRQLPRADCRLRTLECDFGSGQYSDLVAAAERAQTPESYYWRSRAYNELALQAFTRLGELPASPELHELKAHIYNGQIKYSEAASEWKAALALSPDDAQIQKQLAISLKFGQNYEEALRAFQALLGREPASAELNYLTGDTLLDLQRAEEAIPLLTRAVRLDPKLLAAQKSLARADLAIGKAMEAIPHLRAALVTDKDGSLHYQLAKAYQATDQPQLAKNMLAQYQKIQQSAAAESEASRRELEITPP
jgi:tetratricopeptide (TPR) repeat protein